MALLKWREDLSFSETEERVWLKKIDLGRINWYVIKGKRFFTKMESWSFEICEKN